MQFDEVAEDEINVVQQLRAIGMARNLNRVPGGEIRVNLANEIGQLPANAANFFGRSRLARGTSFQLGEQFFDFANFRLEGEISILRWHQVELQLAACGLALANAPGRKRQRSGIVTSGDKR